MKTEAGLHIILGKGSGKFISPVF